MQNNYQGIIIDKRYKVLEKKGGQGKVFQTYDCKFKNHVKFTKISSPSNLQRKNTKNFMKKKSTYLIKTLKGYLNYYLMDYSTNFTILQCLYMVFKFQVDYNLKNYIQNCTNQISTKKILDLSQQMLIILTKLHKNSIIHRDISPQNFVLGKNQDKIHLIDFGLSEYKNVKKNDAFEGNLDFMSINSHQGGVKSYLDDLESLGYIMIYLINKNLPWDSIDDNEKIKDLKIKIKKEYKSIPYIQSYLAYIFSLKQDSFIDYQYLNNTLNVQEYDINQIFDEINMEQKPVEFEEQQSTQEKNSSIISNSPKNQLQSTSLLDIFNENSIIKGMKRVFSQNQIF